MYPYLQQIRQPHSFLIIKAPHLSIRWWHHKLFVVAVICDPDNIDVETLDTLVLWLRVWRIVWWWSGGLKQQELNVQPVSKMSVRYGQLYGVELHFEGAHKPAVEFLLELSSGFNVNPLLLMLQLKVTSLKFRMDRQWIRHFITMISLPSYRFSFSLFCSPSLEQGREFSQPWSSERSRALETTTRKVKHSTKQDLFKLLKLETEDYFWSEITYYL